MENKMQKDQDLKDFIWHMATVNLTCALLLVILLFLLPNNFVGIGILVLSPGWCCYNFNALRKIP